MPWPKTFPYNPYLITPSDVGTYCQFDKCKTETDTHHHIGLSKSQLSLYVIPKIVFLLPKKTKLCVYVFISERTRVPLCTYE